MAQTDWVDATGNWFNPLNWSAGVPGAGEEAHIDNAGTAQINAAGAVADRLILGLSAASVGTVEVSSAGRLGVSSDLLVGLAGNGTMISPVVAR